MNAQPPPSERLTDRETERHMLNAAVALVNERGMSTGLETLAFEDVIRAAGVSRTSAYRRWPKREQFYGDVLLELARGSTLPGLARDVITTIRNLAAERAGGFGDAQNRRDFSVEMLRIMINNDFAIMSTSPGWRTFNNLVAGHFGIADPTVRRKVAEALAAADQQWADLRARAYAQFAAILGYRLTPPLAGPDGFELMSQAIGATMTGMVVKAPLRGNVPERTRPMRAFGSSERREWTPTTYALVATILAFLEPDPNVEWTPGRVGDVLALLNTYKPPEQSEGG